MDLHSPTNRELITELEARFSADMNGDGSTDPNSAVAMPLLASLRHELERLGVLDKNTAT